MGSEAIWQRGGRDEARFQGEMHSLRAACTEVHGGNLLIQKFTLKSFLGKILILLWPVVRVRFSSLEVLTS